jgi:hypothetical protein
MSAPVDLHVKVLDNRSPLASRYRWEIYRGEEPKPIEASARGFPTRTQAASAGQLTLLRILDDGKH